MGAHRDSPKMFALFIKLVDLVKYLTHDCYDVVGIATR